MSIPNRNRAALPSDYCTGLTKRELFAAVAMHGLLAYDPEDFDPQCAAKDAVEYADALLAELGKEEKK